MASGDITVSLERTLHDAIAKLAQRWLDDYGVRLNAARIDWIDTSTVSGDRPAVLASVHLDTTTLRNA